jgi:hypothetical protein
MVEDEQDGQENELSGKSGYPVATEPPFRLNIKRNFKGEYGFEYTVKGDTIKELKLNDYEMQLYLFQIGLITKQPKQPDLSS